MLGSLWLSVCSEFGAKEGMVVARLGTWSWIQNGNGVVIEVVIELSCRTAPAWEISRPKEKASGVNEKTPENGTGRRQLLRCSVEKVLKNSNTERQWRSGKKSKGWYDKVVRWWWWQQAAGSSAYVLVREEEERRKEK
jgi:hypothetical protein